MLPHLGQWSIQLFVRFNGTTSNLKASTDIKDDDNLDTGSQLSDFHGTLTQYMKSFSFNNLKDTFESPLDGTADLLMGKEIFEGNSRMQTLDEDDDLSVNVSKLLSKILNGRGAREDYKEDY